MRPYKRKHHSSWRTRRGRGFVKEVQEFLEPFIYSTKAVWKMESPFPLTGKICITLVTWFLLFLPLCYFLVPPLVALLLLNYFSLRIDIDGYLTRLGEKFARSTWPGKIIAPFKFFDKLTIVFFLYDYYQIFKQFRSE